MREVQVYVFVPNDLSTNDAEAACDLDVLQERVSEGVGAIPGRWITVTLSVPEADDGPNILVPSEKTVNGSAS